MASVCISSCVDDARVPVRATYVNLYKWPESDFEFVRSMSSRSRDGSRSSSHGHHHPRVVDSISCRQMYLRSYTFSREEDYKDEKKPVKCLGRVRAKDGGRRKPARPKKAKNGSCSALTYIFRRLLSCTTEINVAN